MITDRPPDADAAVHAACGLRTQQRKVGWGAGSRDG
eukprot:COSAG05_NODE_26599_length_186_cov_21.827586_1_plen_35_part_01